MAIYKYNAKVRRVLNGYSLACDIDLGFRTTMTNIKLRFKDYISPNLKLPQRAMGLAAKHRLQTIINGNKHENANVEVQIYRDERSRSRWFADIFLKDGTNLSELLIKEGWGISWNGEGNQPTFNGIEQYPIKVE